MIQELLEIYIKGDANIEQRKAVVEWIDQSPENLKEYIALRKLHDVVLWREDEIKQSLYHAKGRTSFLHNLLRHKSTYIGVAAVLMVALFAIYMPSISEMLRPVTYSVVEVPTGQRVNVKLPDGTNVWLNSNTKFKIPSNYTPDNRTCQIDGEGFFEVKKDPSHPFTLEASGYELKVTGTSFNVLSYSGSGIFETSLVEGRLTVADKADESIRYQLNPDQTIFYKDGAMYTKPIEDEDSMLWREGIYVFNDKDFGYIFKMLERYYEVNIDVKNLKVLTYRCTGKFRQKENINHIMKVLQKDNSFKYKIDESNSNITIF